jgi:protease-4
LTDAPPTKRAWLYPVLVFGGLLAACFLFTLILFKSLAGGDGDEHSWTSGKGPKIGVVDVSGVINASKETLSQLIRFRRDKDIKAIVVRVDSPGGQVGPSQEIYAAIQRARKDKKVVVSMGTLAASGGYYIASAADRVWANPGTITGSIGVISEFPEVEALLDLARVKVTTVKSGALKDVGSPLRPMTPEEHKYLQGFVDDVYEQFLSDVASARKLDKEELRKIADGRILTGVEAKKAHLVDELGNLEDAIEGACKLAGCKPEEGEPVPVFARPKRGLLAELLHDGVDGMMRGATDALERGGHVEARDPRF